MARIGGGDHGIRKLSLVEVEYLLRRIAALRADGCCVNSSKSRGRGTVLEQFRSRIKIHPKITRRISRIFGGFNIAERSLDSYVVSILMGVYVAGHVPGEERNRPEGQDAKQRDHTHHDENNFKRAASLSGIRLAGRNPPELSNQPSQGSPYLARARKQPLPLRTGYRIEFRELDSRHTYCRTP